MYYFRDKDGIQFRIKEPDKNGVLVLQIQTSDGNYKDIPVIMAAQSVLHEIVDNAEALDKVTEGGH